MKVLFFTLLCSASLIQGSAPLAREAGKNSPGAKDQVQNEKLTMNYCLRQTMLTIAEIKKGTVTGLPTLEKAQAAQARLEDRLRRIQAIAGWITVRKPSDEAISRAFMAYKNKNKTELETAAKEPVVEPVVEPVKEKRNRIGITFSEHLKREEKKGIIRSVSAPTTTKEKMSAQDRAERTISEEDSEESINETFGSLFKEKA